MKEVLNGQSVTKVPALVAADKSFRDKIQKGVVVARIEPATNGLLDQRSTD